MTNDRILTRVTTLGGNNPWAQGQSFMTVEQLQAQIASLTAENERLRGALINIQIEYKREGSRFPHLRRVAATNCRAALQPKEKTK